VQTPKPRKTGFVFAEQYMWHDTQRYNLLVAPSLTVQPGQHAENEETKRRLRNLIAVTSLEDELLPIKARSATNDELLRFHTQHHITRIDELCKSGGGEAGGKSPVGTASFDIAKLAIGGVLEAVDAVIGGKVDNAYVLCRPPGHHAEKEMATGFCLFANGVLGIKHAQEVHGLKRIAVFDWDVHHGNGAESAFYDDPDTLTISIHQNNLFPPNRGSVEESGEGAGAGSNVNIPMHPGSGSGAYRAAFDQIVVPALEAFEPEMIFVASGFDASAMDPLGHMMLAAEDYAYMTEKLMKIADKHSQGRLLMTHEGGYSAAYVPYCGLAVLEIMSGHDTGVEDPFMEFISNYGGQALLPHHQQAIDDVKEHHKE